MSNLELILKEIDTKLDFNQTKELVKKLLDNLFAKLKKENEEKNLSEITADNFLNDREVDDYNYSKDKIKPLNQNELQNS